MAIKSFPPRVNLLFLYKKALRSYILPNGFDRFGWILLRKLVGTPGVKKLKGIKTFFSKFEFFFQSAFKMPRTKPGISASNEYYWRYVVFTLDQYVDMDYSLVYFHHGLASDNKPPLSWLWGLYKVIRRNFKFWNNTNIVFLWFAPNTFSK